MGKTIAICNQKGGTGKTTSAINISSYLAILGKNILLIDLDPQGNATSGLGIDKESIAKSAYHLLLEDASLDEVIVKTQINNLSLVPATVDLSGAEVELVSVLGRESRLKKAIEPLKNNFDFIIIDCPPSLGLLTVNALCSADSVFIPLQCEYYALEGLSQLIRTIGLVKNNLNQNLEIEGVFLTMADFRTNLTREVISEARSYFSHQGINIGPFGRRIKVFDTVIPRSVRLTEAPSFGKPIAMYDETSIGAKKYFELAKEFLGIAPETDVFETPVLKQTTGEIKKV